MAEHQQVLGERATHVSNSHTRPPMYAKQRMYVAPMTRFSHSSHTLLTICVKPELLVQRGWVAGGSEEPGARPWLGNQTQFGCTVADELERSTGICTRANKVTGEKHN